MKLKELIKIRKSSSIRLLMLVTTLFVISITKCYATDAPGIPDGWKDGYAFVNGIRIHYYQAIPAPEKPVIVMVHGVTDNGLCWTTLALELQDEYNIYMLDTRGHGLSDPFTCEDNSKTLAKDVVEFVKVMKFNKPIIMGHSMGAATVMQVAADNPNLAQSVIMLDPFISRPVFNPGKEAAKAKSEKPKEDKKIIETKPISLNMFGEPETLVKQNNYSYEDLVKKGKRDNPKWDIVDVKYWALSKKQYHGAYSSEAWQVMSGIMQTGDALSRITVPALVLKADTSLKGRKANEEAVKGLKNIKLLHIDGAAHNLHHDELMHTVKEIRLFLSGM